MTLFLTSGSVERTEEIGRLLGEICRPGDWIGLSGELGAGKTCLVRGLARGLKVAEDQPVTSPTFVIHQVYSGLVPIHHLDLYRLRSEAELLEIGYEELVEEDGVVVVEWCEKIPGAVTGRGLLIRLEIVDFKARAVTIEAKGNRGIELLSELNVILKELGK